MTTSKSKTYRKPRSTSTKGHYVTNAQLMEEIERAKKLGRLTDELARCLRLIAERYSYSSNFGGYSFREDMVSFALVNLCANWHKFDPQKSDNPFAFYTTAVYRSFLQYLSEEKKQRDIRDELLLDAGASPSFSFQERAAGRTSDDIIFREETSQPNGS